MNPPEHEVIPAVFAPPAVRLARLHALGTVGQYRTGNLPVEAQQVAQHVLVVCHIVVYRYDNRVRKVFQRRNQFPVRADIPVVVPYLEERIVCRQLLQLLRDATFAELRNRKVKHHLVRKYRTLQNRPDSLGGIGYRCRKRGQRYNDFWFGYIRIHAMFFEYRYKETILFREYQPAGVEMPVKK